MDRSYIEALVRERVMSQLNHAPMVSGGKRELIVAGNWKMNMTAKETKAFIKQIKEVSLPDHILPMIFPPYPYLYMFRDMLRYDRIAFGAQDVAKEEKGAYTGEVSATMLGDIGCSYVIVGHSERRSYYGDTEELVGQKAQAAFSHGLTPIICIGETLEERQSGHYQSVLKSQLDAVYREMHQNIVKCIIAYEPVWAIGTGVIPTMEEIRDTHGFIKDTLYSYENEGRSIPILYGGSANEKNVVEISGIGDVGGFLIGGASLKAESFGNIIQLLS